MKKTFKGFTLIECIVALAILGVASLTMAQIYANVAMKNRDNHIINSSLSNQMADVEKYLDADTVKISFDVSMDDTTKKPPHADASATSDPQVKIESSYDDNEYSYGADIFVLKSRDTAGGVYPDAQDNPTNLRYKYLQGHGG